MNTNLLDIVNVKAIIADRDYISLILIIIVVFSFVLEAVAVISIGLLAAGILWRSLFLQRRESFVDEIYEQIIEMMNTHRAMRGFQNGNISIKILQDYFPKVSREVLTKCFERLKGNREIKFHPGVNEYYYS